MPSVGSAEVFVLDNGAYTIKAGFSSQTKYKSLPNSITKAKSERRRAFIADQIEDCRDLSSLFYQLPFQKGYLINWDFQKTIWDYMFGKNCFDCDPEQLHLIFTEPFFNFTSIGDGLNELLFEEYRFKSVLRTHTADLACYKNKLENPLEEAALVIDTGYSFTHIVPFIAGRAIHSAIIRIDVGGKLLSNHLKDIISYRQLHVLEETYVMNACKEDACFVSMDFESDMKKSLQDSKLRVKKNNVEGEQLPVSQIARDYVLPDFTTIKRGFLKAPEETGKVIEGEQTIRMNNERFVVPELLFNPSDVGILQCGLPEAIILAISKCDTDAHPWLYRNIVLTGGNANFPNFKERLEKDVRALAPDTFKVVVRKPEDTIGYGWSGGASLAKDPAFTSISVSREEYLERGHTVCDERYFL